MSEPGVRVRLVPEGVKGCWEKWVICKLEVDGGWGRRKFGWRDQRRKWGAEWWWIGGQRARKTWGQVFWKEEKVGGLR